MSTLFHTRLENFIQTQNNHAFLFYAKTINAFCWIDFDSKAFYEPESEWAEVVIESTRKTAADWQWGAVVAKIGACLHLWGLWWENCLPSSSLTTDWYYAWPGLSRLNCQSIPGVITINLVLQALHSCLLCRSNFIVCVRLDSGGISARKWPVIERKH